MNNRLYIWRKWSFGVLCLCIALNADLCWPHNLLSEKIRKLVPRKTAIYRADGIFFVKGDKAAAGNLNATRHFYSSQSGYERLVFDFKGKNVPMIYGYISQKEKKLYIDMFQTSLSPSISTFGNSYFVKNLTFYPIDKDSLSLEIELKSPVQFDIFYLENPGRLVVDIKNS